jgi:outer membrane receptor protein involved in Fe transport
LLVCAGANAFASGAMADASVLERAADAGVEPVAAESAPVLTPAGAAPTAAAATTEVTVRGTASSARQLQRSADAVNVVDLRKAKQQTADLGEVLARTQGVAVRRDGGLGSGTRFSLNGLYDDQVRFFVDGVPLDLAGYPFGIANVPVNLVERVEVYRGVVPIRFGADALGGAVNLVSEAHDSSRFGASYQAGSFGTHRASAAGRYRHVPSGLVVGGAAFMDRALNDYFIDVEIPDERGRLHAAHVRRFHDAYRAYGGNVELGVVDRSWAKQLLVSGFAATYDKQLQHNLVMTVPYGKVRYGESVYGATARYAADLSRALELQLVGSYARRRIDFVDRGKWVYDFRGDRVRERTTPGEIEGDANDQTIWQEGAFGRALLTWSVAAGHALRASLTPQFTTRTGRDRLKPDPELRDALAARRELFTLVSGLEYELSLFDERLSNVLFVKDYVYRAHGEDPEAGAEFRRHEARSHSQGAGDSLRFAFTPWLYAKASYEYATRLPRADEVFGNGVLVTPNLELKPEVSHNANLGPRLELRRTKLGDFTLDLNAFLRQSERLIVLLGADRDIRYQNVYKARGLGVENALFWSSPGRWTSLDATVTWQDVRNVSKRGTFGTYAGDRVPNRPYLFASWGGRARVPGVPRRAGALEPFYNGRYVHSFYRAWESQGLREFKQVVETQVSHSVGLSWIWQRDGARAAATFEVDNLTDAKLFDNYGVQRPGRAFYAKVTGEL